LKKFLTDDDSRVRANTIEALDLLGGQKFLKDIEPFVYDSNSRVRANAAVALWKWGQVEIGSILERLSYETKAKDRSCAVFAAGELYNLSQRNNLIIDKDLKADAQAVLTNEFTHYNKLISIIERLINDKDSDVRKQALHAAGKVKHGRLINALLNNLNNTETDETKLTCNSLIETGLPLPVVKLVKKLKETK